MPDAKGCEALSSFKVSSKGRVVCSQCLFSKAMGFRMKGLLGRSVLSDQEGILLKPCNSIHMFFMGFAIDAIFLDKSNRILKIYSGIKPWRISGIHFKSASVLEIASGVAARTGLQVGDTLTFERSTPEPKAASL